MAGQGEGSLNEVRRGAVWFVEMGLGKGSFELGNK